MANFLIFIAVIVLAGALGFSIYWILKQQSQRKFEVLVGEYATKTWNEYPFRVSDRIEGLIEKNDFLWIKITDKRGSRAYGRLQELFDLEEHVTNSEERELQAIARALHQIKKHNASRPRRGAKQHMSMKDGELIHHGTGLRKVLAIRDHMVIRIAQKDSGNLYIDQVRISMSLTNYVPDFYDVSTNEKRLQFDAHIINDKRMAPLLLPELEELKRIDGELAKYNINKHKFIYENHPETNALIVVGYDPLRAALDTTPETDGYSNIPEA